MTRIRMLAIVALLVVPSAAFAQSDPSAPMPPPPPPQGGYPPPPPQGGYPPPPQGGYPPPQGYPLPHQGYQQPYPENFKKGMTFEANLGFGWLHSSESDDSSELGVAGLSLGVGGWANERLAITARLAGVTLSENGFRLSGIFLGPSAQYWIQDQIWIGGGAGLGILAVSGDNDGDSITGFGLDLRAGYTLNRGSDSTFNISIEVTPGFFSENGSSATISGVGFLLGYQHL